eukprot:8996093-Prorocentrum_lima.AAC.1
MASSMGRGRALENIADSCSCITEFATWAAQNLGAPHPWGADARGNIWRTLDPALQTLGQGHE